MKYLPFLIICLSAIGLANGANAQQKKPLLKVPPVKKAIQVETPPPPPPTMGRGAPSVAISPAEAKYEREKICTNCDTLVLEPNKKHILIYDVKWMTDSESKKYNPQPTASDLSNSYFALRGENKREWNELKANYPESEFTYHHVYRNTYIKTPNKSQQVLNLLNRQNRHEGFLYWSGKENDSTIKRTRMALLTETVAKQTGLKKQSSYYQKFVGDSLSIVNCQKTKNPSANIAANLNTFLLDEVLDDKLFPIQFFDVQKVSKITIQSQTEEREKMIFTLNAKGQLTEIVKRKDTLKITYKDDLPTTVKRGSRIKTIYYQGDTVIFKDAYNLRLYKQVGKMFFNVKTYLITDNDYQKMTLNSDFENILTSKNNICFKSFSDERETSAAVCYSNANWQLPLTVSHSNTYKRNDFSNNITYNKVDEKLVIESLNELKSNKFEYTLVDNKPTLITNLFKRGNDDFGKPYLLTVTYEYHK